jgi:hypothetical protein
MAVALSRADYHAEREQRQNALATHHRELAQRMLY